MSGPLRLIEVAHASNTGRVRNHNEDRYLARPPLLAVADGMGGAKAGEVAAQITVETLAGLGDGPTPQDLREAIVEANRRIRTAADEDRSRTGMGTTATAALFDGEQVTLMHVGDSRGYLYREGELRQLTDDHSVVAEMVRQGQLLPEEAERHRSRNIITRALGAEPEVEIDEVRVPLYDGDMILLCSDGLSSLVHDEEIAQTIARSSGVGEAVEGLVAAALDRGGTDNITVVLARFDGPDAAPAGVTGELAVVADATVADATEPIRIPPPPASTPKGARTPVVLEPTALGRGPRFRRALGLTAIGVLMLGALGAWIGSRTYFVDGAQGQTVRVYHGAPVDLGPLTLFAKWADTGVTTAAVSAVDPGALGRSARGQGDAVRHAVELIWRFGLPTILEITVPPPPAPPEKPTRTAAP